MSSTTATERLVCADVLTAALEEDASRRLWQPHSWTIAQRLRKLYLA